MLPGVVRKRADMSAGAENNTEVFDVTQDGRGTTDIAQRDPVPFNAVRPELQRGYSGLVPLYIQTALSLRPKLIMNEGDRLRGRWEREREREREQGVIQYTHLLMM